MKPRPPSHKNGTSDRQQVLSYHNSNYKKSFDARNIYKNKEKCQKHGHSIHIEGLQSPAKKYVNLATSIDTLQAYATKRKKVLSSQGKQSPYVASGSCICL